MEIAERHQELANMSAPAFKAPMQAPVPSPCVSLCKIDAASQLCSGCWRSIDEIILWGGADDHVKRSVWAAIARRKAGQASALPGQS